MPSLAAVRSRSFGLVIASRDTIATRLLTTTLDIQEKLVTSKLRPSLAIAADSAISEARRKSHCALNVFRHQIVLREETIALIVLSHIIWSSQKSRALLKGLTKRRILFARSRNVD
ncbi:hypothetical protein ALC60_07992 [Trachymyrmex zeteki]|uniref:Uncharacterized protein n=1 Tax=Mycetomoellerius zeteki TaxID=64791 RepID=A0A151WYF1_9HYME|nr:hypothetical protein ALC60_07992 [Trachymyrmex zeteki]